MEATRAAIDELIRSVGTLAKLPEVQLLIELVLKQQQIEAQQQQLEKLKEELSKLKHRTSDNSSVPPSQDLLKKPSRKGKDKRGKKRGPKYDHPGTTRNGFGQADHIQLLSLETCPECNRALSLMTQAPVKVQQVAELVEKPVEIWEYQRPKCQCDECGWEGYAPLPWGVKEGFSYGASLLSVVGWFGYGGNLTWHKQIYVVDSIFKIPISQGRRSENASLAPGKSRTKLSAVAQVGAGTRGAHSLMKRSMYQNLVSYGIQR